MSGNEYAGQFTRRELAMPLAFHRPDELHWDKFLKEAGKAIIRRMTAERAPTAQFWESVA